MTNQAKLYQDMIEGTQTAILAARVDTSEVLYANKAWCRLQRVPDGIDIVGTAPSNLADPALRVVNEGDIATFRADRMTTLHRERPDGTKLTVHAKLMDWEGVSAYILYVYDVTVELEAQGHLQSLLDNLPAGVAIFELTSDGAFNRTYVNEGFFTMMGSTREERAQFNGWAAGNAVHEDDRANVQACAKRLLAGADRDECEFRLPDGRGQWRWVNLRVAAVDRTPARILVYATYSDINQDMRNRHTLKESEATLKAALELTGVSVCRIDLLAHSMHLDPGLARLLGLPDQVPNMPEGLIEGGHIHPDDVEQVREMFRGLYGGRQVEGEIRQRYGGDEDYRWARIMYLPLKNEQGVYAEAIGASMDINEQRQKARLQEALAAAEAASEAKTMFLSNMSHEIRTPMNAIIGITKLATGVDGNPQQTQRYLHELGASSQHLLSVLNDVLDMSRIESGRLELHPAWEPVGDLFGVCIEMMEPVMAARGITFHHPDIGNAPRFDYYMDALRMRQVYMNLLSNAAKFTPQGGDVWFEARHISHDEHMTCGQVIVRDSGCGMSKEFLQKIFQPFEREQNTFSGTVEGTGLGLAISKNIIEAMGGTIEVASELGQGTSFTVTTTFRYRATREAAPDAQGPVVVRAGLRVMLVDDNALNRMVASRLLEQQDVVVDERVNGQDAVDAFAASQPGEYDLVLMDVRMPGMDGLEATRAIRALGRPDAAQVPIVAMTADAFEDERQATLDAGMDAHLTKPVDPQKLYETIQRLARG